MINLLSDKKILVGEGYESPFLNKNGVYQDGTVPFCRDKNGKLWAIAGHSHAGNIAMFCGDTLEDMTKQYDIKTNFCVGNAEYAFDKIKYPEGIRARGSVWPFGLYICPGTDRFFCFFHNESGWNGVGTAYDAAGYCETPRADSDFRHVGLMHSDDEGRHWTFDRWVLTGEEVCFTEKFNPDGVNVLGQTGEHVCFGCGDFSLFIPEDDDFIYIYYNKLTINTRTWLWEACDAFVARTRKRRDGIMGDFVKYCDGSFCESGNFGKETPVVINAWHPRVARFEDLHCYVMTSSHARFDVERQHIVDYLELRTSEDLIHWSEPITVEKDGKLFGNHYQAIASYHGEGHPYTVRGPRFTVLTCHNGTDVTEHDFTLSD